MQNETSQNAEPDTKACPYCGEEIKARAIKCRFCNEDLQAYEDAQEKELFSGHPAPLYSVGQWCWSILSLGLMAVYYYWVSRSNYFVVTTQRIKRTRGLLNKVESNLDLFRIDDLSLHRPLGMRLLGYSVIILMSSDRDTPDVRLWGIKNADELAEKLRECTLTERKRLGILIHTNG